MKGYYSPEKVFAPLKVSPLTSFKHYVMVNENLPFLTKITKRSLKMKTLG